MTASARTVWIAGSRSRSAGIAAGPAGLPFAETASVRSTFAALLFLALPPGASTRPPSIHFLMTAISASEILGFLGGILG